MNRSFLGWSFLGLAGVIFGVYLTIIGTQANAAVPGTFLVPYPWVWWVVGSSAGLAVPGAILSELPQKRVPAPSTSPSNQPASGSSESATEVGPTFSGTFHGPVSYTRDNADVHQPGGTSSQSTAPRRASLAGPWTKHVDLISRRSVSGATRKVEWASNGAVLGQLRPSQSGGGFDVFDVAGTNLGTVADEKSGMELLRYHDSPPESYAAKVDVDQLKRELSREARLLKSSFGEDPTHERGPSQKTSIELLRKRLPAARRAAERLADGVPTAAVKKATDVFVATWTRVLSLDEDVEQYNEDKRTPGVWETKKQIEDVWDDAVRAIDVVLVAVDAERDQQENG